MSELNVIHAEGDGYGVGRAIAAGTAGCREQLVALVAEAVDSYRASSGRVRDSVQGLNEALREHSPATLAQVDGMAAGYQLPADDLWIWLLGTFFGSVSAAEGGCSVCARAEQGSAGGCWLAKNRDSDRRIQDVQTVVYVRPESGHAWMALSTAGAPGVHSAGMNVRGLSIADTHVPSTDVGPGLPRFSLMMEALERCATVAEAVDYLEQVPRMGFGNLVLADADGSVAAVECGHSHLAVDRGAPGYVVATNHFLSADLAPTCWQPGDSADGVSTRSRRALLDDRMRAAIGGESSQPAHILTDHQDPGGTCVHGQQHATIATVVCRPRERLMQVGVGTPCVSTLRSFGWPSRHQG